MQRRLFKRRLEVSASFLALLLATSVTAAAAAAPGADQLSPIDWQKVRVQLPAPQEYWFRSGADSRDERPSWRTSNPASNFDAVFVDGGFEVLPSGARRGAYFAMSLTGWGRGDEIVEADAHEAHSQRHRFEYNRGSLTEWYINGTSGLEQGFTLDQAPHAVGDGHLRIELELEGSMVAKPSDGGRSLELHLTPSGRVLSYRKLVAFDASGSFLPAEMILVELSSSSEATRRYQIALEVDDRNAVYPVVIDPIITEDRIITPTDTTQEFGTQVSLDGDTLAVAASLGADAYIFERNQGGANNWGQVRKFYDSSGTDNQVTSVSLSGDTVVLGLPGFLGGNGRARIYGRNVGGTNNWGFVQQISASDGANLDQFAFKVAIDGDTIVASAHGHTHPSTTNSAAYVFERSGGTWSQTRELLRPESDFFGMPVAIDGDIIAVSASGTNNSRGGIYVFERNLGSPGNWGERTFLTASDVIDDEEFGASVAIDGDLIVGGAPLHQIGQIFPGAAYVFERNFPSANSWGERAKLVASDGGDFDEFGGAVDITASVVVVGAQSEGSADFSNLPGAAYTFDRDTPSTNSWGEVDKLIASDRANGDSFGNTVAVDGANAIIGARGGNAAYAFGGVGPPATGTIVIVKDTVPNSPQDFSFTTTGLSPSSFMLDDDSDPTLTNQRTFSNVTAGTYTVTEAAQVGYEVSISCVDPDGGSSVAVRTATIDLDAGETVTCTFTNTELGTIQIITDTVPDGPQDFDYTASSGLTPTSFMLDDDSDPTLTNQRTFNNVALGTYTVTQGAVASFSTAVMCVDPDGGSSTGALSATIDVDAGETVTCTFTNSGLPTSRSPRPTESPRQCLARIRSSTRSPWPTPDQAQTRPPP